MQRRLIVLTIAVWMAASLAVVTPSVAAEKGPPVWGLALSLACPSHAKGLAYYRQETWNYQRRLGVGLTRIAPREHSIFSCEAVLPYLARWRHLSHVFWKRTVAQQKLLRSAGIPAGRPPHYFQWLCIHRYEGAWNDPDPPYFGGLQMNLSFQRAYGGSLLTRKGTADHWTPLEQMWVAERAHRSGRGFHPWPNTARYCHLI